MPGVPLISDFPGALDTTVTLGDVSNRFKTTLTAPLSSSDTTATVASTTGATSTGEITVEDERIHYTSITPTTFAGLLRGRDGSSAAAHASGQLVEARITAAHHLVHSNAIIAIETAHGYGGGAPSGTNKALMSTGTGQSGWRQPIFADHSDFDSGVTLLNGMTAVYNTSTSKWVPTAGAGGISGSGTTGTIPKFSAASALANSVMSESAGALSIIGAVQPLLTIDADSTSAQLLLISYRDSAPDSGPTLYGKRSRGTKAAPAAVTSNTPLITIRGTGYDGAVFSPNNNVQIEGSAESTWSSTSYPTYLSFWTTPVGAIAELERVRLNSAGLLGLGTTSPQVLFHMVRDGAAADTFMDSYGSLINIIGRRAAGTLAAPTATPSGVSLMNLGGRPHDGSAFISSSAALIDISTAGTCSPTSHGALITFHTTPAGSTTASRLERMRIDDLGNVIQADGALATSATAKFFFMNSMAGVPTGVPTTYTGRVPLTIDTANLRIYGYFSGAWNNLTAASGSTTTWAGGSIASPGFGKVGNLGVGLFSLETDGFGMASNNKQVFRYYPSLNLFSPGDGANPVFLVGSEIVNPTFAVQAYDPVGGNNFAKVFMQGLFLHCRGDEPNVYFGRSGTPAGSHVGGGWVNQALVTTDSGNQPLTAMRWLVRGSHGSWAGDNEASGMIRCRGPAGTPGPGNYEGSMHFATGQPSGLGTREWGVADKNQKFLIGPGAVDGSTNNVNLPARFTVWDSTDVSILFRKKTAAVGTGVYLRTDAQAVEDSAYATAQSLGEIRFLATVASPVSSKIQMYSNVAGALHEAFSMAGKDVYACAGNGAALASSATTGFFGIPTISGTPSGNFTNPAGIVMLAYDPATKKLWIHESGSTYRSVLFS